MILSGALRSAPDSTKLSLSQNAPPGLTGVRDHLQQESQIQDEAGVRLEGRLKVQLLNLRNMVLILLQLQVSVYKSHQHIFTRS